MLPDLRAITLKALMKAGGVDYLVRQSEENPMGFLSLLGRVMPRESHVELSGEVKMRQEVRRDLVEKVIVLMRAPWEAPSTGQDAPNTAIEAQSSPLPAITHNPDTLLRAQVSQDKERLTRRGEVARKEAIGTVSGAVHRAEAMHRERIQKKERMPYEEEAAERIDGRGRHSSVQTAEQSETAGRSAESSSRHSTQHSTERTPGGAALHADAHGADGLAPIGCAPGTT